MSTATKNLITAAAAIVKMDNDARETLLLTILESNPTAVMAAMKLNGITFGEDAKPNWHVVVEDKGTGKIHLIKMFREETGAGLADAKMWSEGITYKDGSWDRPAGVIHVNLTRDVAESKAQAIMDRRTHDTNYRVKVVNSIANYRYDANWSQPTWQPSN
jgi:ribosomal protein L7/L12